MHFYFLFFLFRLLLLSWFQVLRCSSKIILSLSTGKFQNGTLSITRKHSETNKYHRQNNGFFNKIVPVNWELSHIRSCGSKINQNRRAKKEGRNGLFHAQGNVRNNSNKKLFKIQSLQEVWFYLWFYVQGIITDFNKKPSQEKEHAKVYSPVNIYVKYITFIEIIPASYRSQNINPCKCVCVCLVDPTSKKNWAATSKIL